MQQLKSPPNTPNDEKKVSTSCAICTTWARYVICYSASPSIYSLQPQQLLLALISIYNAFQRPRRAGAFYCKWERQASGDSTEKRLRARNNTRKLAPSSAIHPLWKPQAQSDARPDKSRMQKLVRTRRVMRFQRKPSPFSKSTNYPVLES